MKLQPVLGIVLRQLYLMRSSPIRVIPLFAWVAVDIVLWGFIARYLNSIGSGKIDFTAQLLGAVLFWDLFTRIMQGVTVAFLEDVWTRNFLNLFATPLRISEYVCGLVLSSIGTSVLGLLAMLVLATCVFGLDFLGLGLLLVPVVGILFVFGIALGIVASAMVLRWGPASEWLIWPIPALLAPFAGVFYPVATLPAWMQSISSALPPSYVFEALRATLAGRPVVVDGLLWAGAIAVVELVLSGAVFAAVHRYVMRSGLLARYSAESVV
ncbi:MAG TPA: ABC transporter permease [Burkholderiaceae bacterium]|nr:ABC transporter permease [Burkholderiaceae bacterium]